MNNLPNGELKADRALNSDPLQASETNPSEESVEWIADFSDDYEAQIYLKIDAVLLLMPESQIQNGSYKVMIGENACPGQS